MSAEKPLVGIILGSKSDAPDFEGCKEMLEKFGVPYEFVIHSAHRNPDDVRDWATSAEERGLKVIIAGAGNAAALGGVVASHTPLPVIAVPMKTSDLGRHGLSALHGADAHGVPLACVAINGHQERRDPRDGDSWRRGARVPQGHHRVQTRARRQIMRHIAKALLRERLSLHALFTSTGAPPLVSQILHISLRLCRGFG